MANRVAIFVDGAYLDYLLKEEFGTVRIDYRALSERMAGDSDILRTYYYHCPPYQGNPPTQDERERYSTQRKFFDTLDRLPRYMVRLGRLAYRGVDDRGSQGMNRNVSTFSLAWTWFNSPPNKTYRKQ